MTGVGQAPLLEGEGGDPPADANRAVLGAGFILTAVVAVVIALVALIVPDDRSSSGCPSDSGPGFNRVVGMATVGDIVEIELRSTVSFPVRALRPVLRIGNEEFLLSRNPDDRRLDTLIFAVPAGDFSTLGAGESVVVYHGQEPPAGMSPGETDGWNAWAFGPFNPSLLDCEPGS